MIFDVLKSKKRKFCSVIIPAAGSSSRMNGENKVFSVIDGIPVIARTLTAFNNCSSIDEIIIVGKAEDFPRLKEICEEYKITKAKHIVRGGSSRQESVYNGLKAIDKKAALAAVHDCARPFVTEKIINDTVKLAARYGAAAPAVPAKDTIKKAVNGVVECTLDRSTLYQIQTPQVFDADMLKTALFDVIQKGTQVTDDCMAVELLGMKVHLSQGDYNNIKITTPEDMIAAESIAKDRSTEK